MSNKAGRIALIIAVVSVIMCLTAVIIAVGPAENYNVYRASASQSEELDDAVITCRGKTYKAKLPCNVDVPRAGTKVTVTVRLPEKSPQYVYVKTVFCPLTVYLDGKVINKLGNENFYPSFMRDPAKEVRFIPIPNGSGGKTLKLVYSSSEGRDRVAQHAPVAGTIASIARRVLSVYGASLAMAWFQVFIGLLVMLSTLSVLRKGGIFRATFWAGLYALLAGLWGVCENNITLWVSDIPAIPYLISYTALDISWLPLIFYVTDMLSLQNNKLMKAMTVGAAAVPLAVILMQLGGGPPLYATIKLYHILLPVTLLILLGVTAREYSRLHDKTAIHIFISIMILGTSAILETLNYYFRFTWQGSLFLEIGLTIFMFYSGLIGVYSMQKANARKQELEVELKTITIETEEQRKRSRLIMENYENTRRQRHDMRHALVVMREFAAEGDNEGLLNYVDSLMDNIPRGIKTYCSNQSVNAIVSYFASQCDEEGIKFSGKINVPADDSTFEDIDLCAVFGNLLENAVEACRRIEGDDRFIRVSSICHLGTLTIAVDNSYDGRTETGDNSLLSSKRDYMTPGHGISSIRSIAEKYKRDAQFTYDGSTFSSLVYMYY